MNPTILRTPYQIRHELSVAKRKERAWTIAASMAAILFLALGLLLLNGCTVQAQTNVGTNSVPAAVQVISGTAILLTLIPLLVPAVIGLVKLFIPNIPTFLLPIAAPIIGAAIDWFGTLGGGTAHPIAAALAGSAGVGLREVYSQVTQAIAARKASA